MFVVLRWRTTETRMYLRRNISGTFGGTFLKRVKVASRFYRSRAGCFGLLPQASTENSPYNSDNVVHAKPESTQLLRLLTAYRNHGHNVASTNPLQVGKKTHKGLQLELCGFKNDDTTQYDVQGILNLPSKETATLDEIVSHLEKIYCGEVSIEAYHIPDEDERLWLYELFESSKSWEFTGEEKVHLAKAMQKSQVFDNFLSKKFATIKRYSGEGAEAMIAFFHELFGHAAKNDFEDMVLCMPHRGRLSLLTCMLNYPPAQMFSKMRGNAEFSSKYKFTGDVLSHLVSSTDLEFGEHKLHVTMVPNPSHLEAVNPVAVGKTRGKLLSKKIAHYGTTDDASTEDKVLCVQVHGDAAFTAQGVVMETLCLANLPHFEVNGSIHLIVNNQIGFTTPTDRGKSTAYTSDVGKMIQCPIVRVNGENPEEVAKACRIAMEYRMKYKKDIIVDLMCYRRWGHNEVDDPSFTQPSMYANIESRKTIPDTYMEKLVTEGIIKEGDFVEAEVNESNFLNSELSASNNYEPQYTHFQGLWKGIKQADSNTVSVWNTGYTINNLLFIAGKSVTVPEDFEVHPHLKKIFCDARLSKLKSGSDLDWATAEALAVGSLLLDGYNVRISGQDVGRGTFSQRHMMLVNQKDDELFIPLNEMTDEQTGFLELVNSPLSEEAVVGFEYGMSIQDPNNLCIWEAQFGDFFNGAQIMFDAFVFQGEAKWLLQSGLVILLPHGQDGTGPEHSSCRLERFLQLSDSKEDEIDGDDVNMEIVNPTTPAQYFHLLRRQMLRNYRKPLVVASPKVILRLAAAVSSLKEMAPGTHFHPVIGDSKADPQKVKKLIFCCGQHFYALDKIRQTKSILDVAIIRLEALTPFPAELIKQELSKYTNAEEFIWSQEEHRNMGGWTFVQPRFQNILNVKLKYVGRTIQPTPATGIISVHRKETEEILERTFQSSK